MRKWRMTVREPSLDELLADEMMGAVTRSAGIDPARLRAMLAELARRLRREPVTPRCGCSAETDCQPTVA